jgi:hypothetical protein
VSPTEDEKGTIGGTTGAAAGGRDWPAEAAARVEGFVEILRDKSIRPVTKIVQFVIYSFALIFLLVAILVLFSIAFVRVFDVYVFAGRVWASDLLVGGIFTLGGMFFLARRQGRGAKA